MELFFFFLFFFQSVTSLTHWNKDNAELFALSYNYADSLTFRLSRSLSYLSICHFNQILLCSNTDNVDLLVSHKLSTHLPTTSRMALSTTRKSGDKGERNTKIDGEGGLRATRQQLHYSYITWPDKATFLETVSGSGRTSMCKFILPQLHVLGCLTLVSSLFLLK